MVKPDPKGPLSVRIARTLAARRERVFQAWIDPQAIRDWFIEPDDAQWTGEPQVDARTGGTYHFSGVSRGKPWSIHGTYREVTPPERLVFTWEWEDHPEPGMSGDTLVTVELFDRNGQTELVLTQERFPSEASREEHREGWEGCLASMDRRLQAEQGRES